MKKILLCAALAAALSVPGHCLETTLSKYKLNVYGMIKLDTEYVNAGTYGNEFDIYTSTDSSGWRNFRSTARSSRIGFDVSDEQSQTSAKVEGDFFGLGENVYSGNTPGATADFRLRHAYVTKKTGDWEFLAGHTWYLIMTEMPDTVNDYYLGYSGCLWSRAPQLRAAYKVNDTFSVAAAAVRPTKRLSDSDGTASGLPGAQALVTGKFGPVTLKLSGAWERWQNDYTGKTADVNLLDAGFNVKGGIFTLNGQAWIGRNLDDFFGGVANTADMYNNGGVRAKGGFFDLNVKPSPQFYANAICGVDKPSDGDVTGSAAQPATAKVQNGTCLGNVNYVLAGITTTVEIAHNATEYKYSDGQSDIRTSTRYQLTFRYPF
jgi:hypothetical protein